jgi:hypothetical protein
LDNTEWLPIKKGDAFQAPMGMTHAIKKYWQNNISIILNI